MATYRYRTRKALTQRFGIKQDQPKVLPATLGNGAGVVAVADRPRYVYVLVNNTILWEVFNNRVPLVHGMQVQIGKLPEQPRRWQVLGTYTDQPAGESGGAGNYVLHGQEHRWLDPYGGTDPVFVELRQILPLRVGMTKPASMSVQVYRGIVWSGTAFVAVAGQDVDLTSYKPASADQAAMVLISIDTTGAVICTKGVEVAISTLADLPSTLANLPAIPAGTVAKLAGVRVFNGQEVVQEGRSNTDITDLRFGEIGGGGDGEVSGLTFDDTEGDPVDVDATAAADGTSEHAARRDHRHHLPNTAVTPGSYTNTNLTVDQQGRITAASNGTGGSGEGGNIGSDVFANLPAGSQGDLFIPTDSKYLLWKGPSAWDRWYLPYIKLTPPDATGFGWTNQGDATLDTSKGFWFFNDPYTAAYNHHVYERNIPAAPWTMTALVLTLPWGNYNSFGLVLRESSSGKGNWLDVIWYQGFPCMYLKYMTNFSGGGEASYVGAQPFGVGFYQPVWMRIQDNNTSWIYSYSIDGVNFKSICTHNRNTNLTADKVGISISCRGGVASNPHWGAILSLAFT